MAEANSSEEPEPIVLGASIATVILSPRFQAISGPGSLLVMGLGYLGFLAARAADLPRPELVALVAIGVAVAMASVAVTLGVILVVSKQTPSLKAAVASIVFGLAGFIAAGPVFMLIKVGSA